VGFPGQGFDLSRLQGCGKLFLAAQLFDKLQHLLNLNIEQYQSKG